MSKSVKMAAAAVAAGLALVTAHEVNAGAHAGGSFWSGAPQFHAGSPGGGGSAPRAFQGGSSGPMIAPRPHIGGQYPTLSPGLGSRNIRQYEVNKSFNGSGAGLPKHRDGKQLPKQWSGNGPGHGDVDHDGHHGHHHHRHVVYPLRLYDWDYGYDGYYSYGSCSWLWQRWLATGNPVWRDRYYDCID